MPSPSSPRYAVKTPAAPIPLYAMLTLALCFVACDGGGDPPPAPPPKSASSMVIGSGGGTLTSQDDNVTLVVPSGALAGDTILTVTPVSGTPPAEFVPGTVYEFEPHGLQFTAPVALTLRYDADQLPSGADEGALVIAKRLDDDVLEFFGGSVDTDAGTVRSEIRSFSTIGVVHCGGDCTSPPVLSAEYNENRTISMSWTYGLSAAQSPHPFLIERAVVTGRFEVYDSDFAPLTTRPANVPWNFTDVGIGAQAAFYYYRIRKRYGNGNLGPTSNIEQITVFGPQDAPEAPVSFQAFAASDTEINLTWSDVAGAERFVIERRTGSEPYAQIVDMPATSLFHTDSNLEPETTYDYRLKAVNDVGESPYVVASETTLDTGASPGEGRIAFASNRDGGTADFDLYVMNADGSGLTPLTANDVVDAAPAWSPDGTRIAFSSTIDGNAEIYVVNADGTNRTRLTTDDGFDVTPAWSPDGTQIVFNSNRDGATAQLFVIDADGSGQPTRLSDATNLHHNAPAWSPDGSRIAFAGLSGDDFDVFVMNADGSGGLTNLTDNIGPYDYDPAWSPDGARIAFVSTRDGLDADIYVMNADGSGVTRLTTDPGEDRSPAWSPDGTQIVFDSTREGPAGIYVMNADGSGVTPLTDDAATDGQPAWGPSP